MSGNLSSIQNAAYWMALTNEINTGHQQKGLMIVYPALKPNQEMDDGITDG